MLVNINGVQGVSSATINFLGNVYNILIGSSFFLILLLFVQFQAYCRSIPDSELKAPLSRFLDRILVPVPHLEKCLLVRANAQILQLFKIFKG